jgi:PAS domain S-box-containing protein
MTVSTQHDETFRDLTANFQPILDRSPDGVYLWLDQDHMACNEQFARLFGASAKEWNARPPSLHDFVVEGDQEFFAQNYERTITRLAHPVTFRFRGRRKDDSTFAAEIDMIPIAFRGHVAAYHFVRQVGA